MRPFEIETDPSAPHLSLSHRIPAKLEEQLTDEACAGQLRQERGDVHGRSEPGAAREVRGGVSQPLMGEKLSPNHLEIILESY